MAKAAGGKKKARRSVARGIAYIKATFNNTQITITDTAGEVLCWTSAGTVGFKGTRKSTPFAAQRAAETAATAAKKFGISVRAACAPALRSTPSPKAGLLLCHPAPKAYDAGSTRMAHAWVCWPFRVSS